MLVKTFISHIKHKSLWIQIVDKDYNTLYFDGTIGEYQTSIAREICDTLRIESICPGLCGDELIFIIAEE